jgi:hypothetical protein
VSPEKEYEKENHECSVSTAAAGERNSSLYFMMAAIAAVEQLSHWEERSRARDKNSRQSNVLHDASRGVSLIYNKYTAPLARY